MHAWEVLSPKMDAGVGYEDVKLATEAHADGTLPRASQLSADQVLGVMDKLLALELVMYRGGYNSLHTFHTMHYVHVVDTVDAPMLALYLRATLFCVNAVVEVARAGEVAFEEDYVRVPPELSLDCGLDRAALMAQLSAADQALVEKHKAGDAGALALRWRLALRRAMVELWQHARERPTKLDGLLKVTQAVGAALNKLAGQFVPEHCPAAAVNARIVSRDLGLVQPARAIPDLDGPLVERELRSLLGDLEAICGVAEWEHPSVEDVFNFLVVLTLRRPCMISRACLRRWLAVGDTMLGGRPALDITEAMMVLYKCPPAYLKHPVRCAL